MREQLKCQKNMDFSHTLFLSLSRSCRDILHNTRWLCVRYRVHRELHIYTIRRWIAEPSATDEIYVNSSSIHNVKHGDDSTKIKRFRLVRFFFCKIFHKIDEIIDCCVKVIDSENNQYLIICRFISEDGLKKINENGLISDINELKKRALDVSNCIYLLIFDYKAFWVIIAGLEKCKAF